MHERTGWQRADGCEVTREQRLRKEEAGRTEVEQRRTTQQTRQKRRPRRQWWKD